MLVPIDPENEHDRLCALQSLNILDSLPEERFDRLTRLTKRLFGVPIAVVSLVDANRQWFKSCVGLATTGTPRDVSFCGHAILNNAIMQVEDARCDDRFRDNPLVTGAPHIRFYAGCPLRITGGYKIGTLCLIDTVPRLLDDEECGLLQDLARMVEQELSAVQQATMDELTMLSNRRGFESLAQHSLNTCKRIDVPACLLFFDLNKFKQINDHYGHAEGDVALKTFADVLRMQLRESDVVGRLGGDEFVALLTGLNGFCADEIVDRLQQALFEAGETEPRGYNIEFSVGQVNYNVDRHVSIGCMLAEADRAMYANKRAASKRATLVRHRQHADTAQIGIAA